jgi:transcriptional regulator with XRE-family HTH domain
MGIGSRVCEILKERGITQKQFSKMTGIAESTISDWKRKGFNPSADKIGVICDALNITLDELYGNGKGSLKRAAGADGGLRPGPQRGVAFDGNAGYAQTAFEQLRFGRTGDDLIERARPRAQRKKAQYAQGQDLFHRDKDNQ